MFAPAQVPGDRTCLEDQRRLLYQMASPDFEPNFLRRRAGLFGEAPHMGCLGWAQELSLSLSVYVDSVSSGCPFEDCVIQRYAAEKERKYT